MLIQITVNLISLLLTRTLQELLKLPKDKTSLDIIDMDCKLPRLASPIIAPSLTHIFNLSLAQGQMPSGWKIARVNPVYKNKGSKDDPGNYRPISVVPTVTKIIEKNIKAQLVNYFTVNNFSVLNSLLI